ncbi:MAG: molybdenum cofactor guanylyltransferase [Armatimonadetes bacterium]|nr:molybdenum cofactor guanylyltransferase [Armatimonadota bacterium]
MLRDVEAVLLTGGQSKRMGQDKASLIIHGEPMGRRIARELAAAVEKTTVLGREAIPGYAFQLDEEEFGGPRSALRAFTPSLAYVFVASCDLPLFRSEIVGFLRERIDGFEAAICRCEGELQPLCALYARSAFDSLVASPASERRLIRWVEQLRLREVDDEELRLGGIDPRWVRSANTAGELERLL